MKHLVRPTAFWTAVTVLLVSAAPSHGLLNHYVEDFKTTTYRDPVSTTASWDTDAGALKLPPFGLTVVGGIATGNFASGVAVSGDYAYVGSGSVGLKIVDISDPLNPSFAGQVNTPGMTQGVAVAGNYAYLADNTGGLRVVDITDPTQPVEVAAIALYAFANNVVIAGNYAYVAVWAGGLHVVDITDPTNPTRAGHYPGADFAYDIVVEGDYAYLTDSGFAPGLHVVDISDPTTPTLAAFHPTVGSSFGVAVSGDHAYLANWTEGIEVLDISDPTQPSPVATVDTPYTAYHVAVSGDHAYVGDRLGGFHVLDISDPAVSSLIATVATPDQPHQVVIAGGYAYVADWASGLQVIQISERRVRSQDNTARSLVVDNSSASVRRARLAANQVGMIDWELSADGGGNWQDFVPGASWQTFAFEGNDVLWRSTLSVPPGTAAPVCTQLDIQWLYEFAVIDSVVDVPGDQGGWARIYFSRSDHDFTDQASLPILAYNIHRRIDDPALAGRLLEEGELIHNNETVTLRNGVDVTLFVPAGGDRALYRLRDRYYLLNGSSAARVVWEVVGTVFSQQQDQYAALVPTIADASQTIPYSVYYVSAHTTTPTVFFDSPPDSGYSIDNIAPGVPQGFQVAYNTGTGNRLAWDASGGTDFQFFRVYRSTVPNFSPAQANLVHVTAGTEWTDPGFNGWSVHYGITAVDHAGNESAAATPGTATGMGDVAIPTHFRLYQNAPNPFNPTTTIRYDVATGGGRVTLRIYDVAGRLVRKLLDGHAEAGSKSVTWDGTNDRGRRVASGVYFYRFQAPGFRKTLKMTLLQ